MNNKELTQEILKKLASMTDEELKEKYKEAKELYAKYSGLREEDEEIFAIIEKRVEGKEE